MYKVIWDEKALYDLDTLSLEIAKSIQKKVNTYLAREPKSLSKALIGKYKGQRRYRWNCYRIIFTI